MWTPTSITTEIIEGAYLEKIKENKLNISKSLITMLLLLTLIAATTPDVELRKTILFPFRVDMMGGHSPGVRNTNNAHLFKDWIHMNIKPKYRKDIESLLKNPARFVKYSSGPISLASMLSL